MRVGRRGRWVPRLALVVLLSLTAVTTAHAQAAPDGTLRASLTLTEFTGVLGAGVIEPRDDPQSEEPPPTDLTVRVLAENLSEVPLDTLQLVTEVFPPVTTRPELHDVFDDGPPTEPVQVHNRVVADSAALAPGEVRGVSEHLEGSIAPWRGAAPGVFPVRLSLVRGTEVLDDVTTAVVWLPERLDEPTTTSLVLPFDDAPWRSGGGRYHANADRHLAPGGRLDALLTAVERTGAPVVLAPSAHLLEDLSDRSDGFEVIERDDEGQTIPREVSAGDSSVTLATTTLRRLRELAAEAVYPPVTGTYADADLSTLLDGPRELRELAAEAAVDGRRRVQALLGAPVDAATHLVGGRITPEVLDVLPGDVLLLGSDAVDLSDTAVAADPVRRLTAPSGRLVTAVVADPVLEDVFDSATEGGAVHDVQRILAELAIATIDDAAAPTLLLLPPWDTALPARTAERLLQRLDGAPWVRLQPPTDLVRIGAVGGEGSDLAPPSPAFDTDLAARLEASLGMLTAASAATEDDGDRIGSRAASRLHDDLVRATSRRYDTGSMEATGIVDAVDDHLQEAFGGVEVASGSVTLTSDTGQIPVTLRRTAGGPLLVRVTLDSPGGLRWPEGRTSEPLLLEPEASQTVTFPAQALSTGSFPVTVRVTDPTGEHELTREAFPVRSTAFSGTALAGISVVVLGLLLFAALRRNPESATPLHLVGVPGRDPDPSGE